MSVTAATLDRPAPTPAFATPDVIRMSYTDSDELVESMKDWKMELTRLDPGAFECGLALIPLGPILIARAHYSRAVVQRVRTPSDCLTICRPARGSAPVLFRGREVAPGDIVVVGPGAEGENASRGAIFATGFSVRLSFIEAQSQWLGVPQRPTGEAPRLHPAGERWVGNYLDALEWIDDAVSEYPDATRRKDVQHSLVDALLARINTLPAGEAAPCGERQMRAKRRLAVARAREYIRAHLTEPIRLSDLCRYTRTQSRSLEYGFREVLGVSPIAYIRMTRLHLARSLLRSSPARHRSISEIALDCGFWHLSQFAADYKACFAESPSVTYRRTRALATC